MDTPTKDPANETTVVPPIPARIKGKGNVIDNPNLGGPVKATTPGIKKMSMPAIDPKSYQAQQPKREDKFNARGAAKPWKSKGCPATSKGSSDVKPKAVSKRTGDASKGISQKTGYKKIR